MKIGLAPYISLEITKHSELLNEIESKLKDKFDPLFYGEGLLEIYIGIICVSPAFEQFFIPRKAKYTFESKTYIKEGIEFTTGRTLEYDIKIDFDLLKDVDKITAYQIILRELTASLDVFESMKKKIKNFDSQRFISDLTVFFYELG